MRISIIIASIIGLVLTGFIALLVLLMSSAWDGKASASLVIWLGLAGFVAISFGSVFGYHRNWYKPVAFLGAILVACSSYPWFLESEQLPGLGMLLVAALTILDICKNH